MKRAGTARLRRARATDLHALVALERRAFRHERLDRAAFRRRLDDPRALLLVVARTGGLLGYALARVGARGTARLDSIAVVSAARGAGLGVRLLAAVEGAARARGATRLVLEVRPRNRAARALYTVRGYALVARLAAYYAAGRDALRYEKRLRKRLAPRGADGP